MKKFVSLTVIYLLSRVTAFAQNTVANEIGEMEGVLNGIYGDMVELSSHFIMLGRVIGGVGAMLYISMHVWVKLARAEQIDFLPLFKPLVFGFAIILYPHTLSAINGLLHSTVAVSETVADTKHAAVEKLLNETEKHMKGSPLYTMYIGPDGGGDFDKYLEKNQIENTGFTELDEWVQFKSEAAYYKMRNTMRFLLFHFFAILFQAAAFIINVLRTFILIILAIIGPFVMGISIWPGLGDSFINWLVRYVHVYFWLPVANIFGAIIAQIQENMLTEALLSTEELVAFSANDALYIIFMITGIIGYFSVPSVASYIAHPGQMGALLRSTTRGFNMAVIGAQNAAQNGAESVLTGARNTALAGAAAHYESTLSNPMHKAKFQEKASDFIKNKLS